MKTKSWRLTLWDILLPRNTSKKTGLPVIIGTHPMPTNYITMHEKLNDWTDQHLEMLKNYNLMDEHEAKKYDSSRLEYVKELKAELSK